MTSVRGSRAGVAPLLVLVILAGCSSPAGSAGPTPGTTGEATEATLPPAVSTWRAIEVELGEGLLSDIDQIGDSVVAVGSTGAGPIALASADGVAWTRAPEQPAFETPGAAGMSGLIVSGQWLNAVGPGDRQTVAWRSKDGLAWDKAYESRFPTDEELAEGYVFEGFIARGTAGPAGLVAIGQNVNGLTGDFGGAAWTSPDGTDWEPAPVSVQLSRAPIYDIAVLPDGTYTAVGGYLGAVSLVSMDGRSWTLHELRDVLSGGQLRAVATGANGGVVAVGDETAKGFSATSADGAVWQRGVCNGAMTDAAMYAVAALGDGFVAGGAVGDRAAIWTSVDGMTWARVRADLGAGRVSAIVPRGNHIVAVGSGLWVGPVDAVGDDGLYPETPCDAPNPDGPPPEPTSPTETPALPPAPTEATKAHAPRVVGARA